VVNLVCKKEDSVSCWFKTHQPRQGQRPIGRFFVLFYKVVFFWICRNSNTQMSRNKSIDDNDVDLLQLDVQELNLNL
jgi:hypothetical protein